MNNCYPFDENNPANGVEYCPMCGSGEDKESNHGDANEAIKLLAEWYSKDPMGCGAALTCIAHPTSTQTQLAAIMGVQQETVKRRLARAAAEYPKLIRMLGLITARCLKQTARRAKEAKKGRK